MTPRIVLVSKPVGPPYNDSGKNYIRDLVRTLPAGAAELDVMTTGNGGPLPSAVRCHFHRAVTGPAGMAPGFLGKAGVAAAAAVYGRHADALQFAFAPNPSSARMARLLMSWTRCPAIQTVLSAPAPTANPAALFFGTHVVTVSAYTRRALENAGIAVTAAISPCVESVGPPTPFPEPHPESWWRPHRRFILFAGDYEFSGAWTPLLFMWRRIARRVPSADLVIACRAKTPAARTAEAHWLEAIANAGLLPRTHFLGEVRDMPGLLRAMHLQVFPAHNLYAKMDLPMVLLEGLAHGVPCIVSGQASLPETVAAGGGLVYHTGDDTEFSNQVLHLLTAGAAWREQREKAYHAARTAFAPQAFGAAWAQVYARLSRR